MKKGRQGLAGLRLVAPAAAAAAAPRSYSHVTGLSPWQRLQTTTAAALGAFHNPERGDLVALLGEVTGKLNCIVPSAVPLFVTPKGLNRRRSPGRAAKRTAFHPRGKGNPCGAAPHQFFHH